ncbi:MAG: DUF167 domain-containing protein [Candidatus Aenigmarchaeota archaeon]|nr:DUF167 domain-containing protein [Candidatus Aenigmarchaeota archaeon]
MATLLIEMIIKARIYPNSKQSKVVDGETVKIYVTKPAEDGKANQAVIEILADFYNVSKSCIKIVKGMKTREKLIEINA